MDLGTSRLRAVPHRAAQLLDPRPRDRAGDPAGRAALRHGHAGLQPARRRHADRPVPSRSGERQLPLGAHGDAALPRRAPPGRRRAAGRALRRDGDQADAPGDGLRHRAPRCDVRDRRPAHDGAARGHPRGGRRGPERRDPRPHRRDRAAGGERRRDGHGVPGAGSGGQRPAPTRDGRPVGGVHLPAESLPGSEARGSVATAPARMRGHAARSCRRTMGPAAPTRPGNSVVVLRASSRR